MLQLEDIKSDRDKHEGCYISKIPELSQSLRDSNEISVYAVKSRYKTAESCYLKMRKRNIENFLHLGDLAGIRVVCLVECDIWDVFHYIFKQIRDGVGVWSDMCFLESRLIGSWSHSEVELKRIVSDLGIPNTALEPSSNNKSRVRSYKSLHLRTTFKAKKCDFPLEIQIRTLLQDTWAEFSHRMVYKRGKPFSTLSDGFEHLSITLSNLDRFVSTLKKTTDRSDFIERQSRKDSSYRPLTTKNSKLLPDSILSSDQFKYYQEQLESWKDKDKESWLSRTQEALDSLKNDILSAGDQKQKYWLELEEAFLHLSSGNDDKLNKADESYQRINDSLAKSSLDINLCPIEFRLGLVSFLKHDYPNALVYFDSCRESLEDVDSFTCDIRYLIFVRLAFLYGKLDEPEFLQVSLELLKSAKSLVHSNQDFFSTEDEYSVKNNLCWYALRLYQKKKSKENLKRLKKYLEELESTSVETKNFPSNFYHTIAICYFEFYREKPDEIDFLKQAKELIVECQHRDNRSMHSLSSNLLQNDDMVRILAEAQEKGI